MPARTVTHLALIPFISNDYTEMTHNFQPEDISNNSCIYSAKKTYYWTPDRPTTVITKIHFNEKMAME